MKLPTVHDPGHVILRRGLRIALVLPLTYLFVANVLQLDAGATYAVFGTFALLGICDFGGPTKDRAFAYLLTGAAGFIAIAVGSLLAYNDWAAVFGTLIIGALISFSTLLRGYISSAQLGVLLPFVIAVTATPALSELPQRLEAFAFAVVVSTVSALVLWPSHTRSALRLRIGDCLIASANFVRTLWPAADAAPSTVDLATRSRELVEAHNKMREQYDGRLLRPGSATARDRAVLQLIDEISRLRFFLKWEPDSDQLRRPEDCELARVTADTLDASAAALQANQPPPDPEVLDLARELHRTSGEQWAGHYLTSATTEEFENAVDASFHLRMAALSSELVARYTGAAVGVPPAEPALRTAGVIYEPPESKTSSILRSNLTIRSPWFRLALRTGLALTIAVAVVAFADVQHGFWVVLGTLTALRLDASGTSRTAIQAIVGTVSGFVIGTALILVFGEMPGVMWALLIVAIFLSGFTPGAVGLAVGQASFTVFVILFYGILLGPTVTTGELRVMDVGIGLVISFVVSALMWPRGVAARIRTTLQEAVHASTAALVAAYARLAHGPEADAALDAAAAQAMVAGQNAAETFDLAIAQSGPATQFGDSWSMIANSARHISSCANLVTFMARGTPHPINCDQVEDSLLACAHIVAADVNSMVDQIEPEFSNVRFNSDMDDDALIAILLSDSYATTLGEPFQQLQGKVTSCLESAASNAESQDATTVGGSAISMIFARDWLLHIGWLTKRLELVVMCSPQATNPAKSTDGAGLPTDGDTKQKETPTE